MVSPKRYNEAVAAALTPDFRSGGAVPPLDDFLEPAGDELGVGGQPLDIDLDLIRSLIDHALDQEFSDYEEPDHVSQLDGWLASRIHFSLRITRRLAADPGFWSWLSIEAGRRYVVHRWARYCERCTGTSSTWRFTGGHLRNGLSRLWWAAEMVRNGSSYEFLKPTFARVWTAQYALELKYSWYPAATIAFVKVAEGLGSRNDRLSADEMKLLSKRINAFLSLRSLEGLGLYEVPPGQDVVWWTRPPTLREATAKETLGPEDSSVSIEAIEQLEEWYRSLVARRS